MRSELIGDRLTDEVVFLTHQKEEGIRTGNAVQFLYACHKLNSAPTEKEVESALRHAISREGYCIDNEETDVGKLYRMLYGRDFDRTHLYLGTLVSYKNLPPEEKEKVNRQECWPLFEDN